MSENTRLIKTDLTKLNILKLYETYGALERSLPLLTPESQELAKAELEACIDIRSEKIDRVYYAMASHEDALSRIKQEGEMIVQAKRHHESQIKQLKALLNWLRRSAPLQTNRITGRNYEFVLVKKKDLTVEISSNLQDWDEAEQKQFCIQQEVTTTKQTVVRSMSGEILEERTEPKTTTETLPSLDAIRNAYQTGQHLPSGIKVIQEYSIRTKRIYRDKPVDLEASEYFGHVLPEAGTPD
jgi:hypothetical protein